MPSNVLTLDTWNIPFRDQLAQFVRDQTRIQGRGFVVCLDPKQLLYISYDAWINDPHSPYRNDHIVREWLKTYDTATTFVMLTADVDPSNPTEAMMTMNCYVLPAPSATV